MESIIGTRWTELGSIDWEGNCPVLDRELRVVKVVPFDALADDESFLPVAVEDRPHGLSLYVVSRSEISECIHDAYMARADFSAYFGNLPGVLDFDLCENPETEERVANAFPVWAEAGAIPSHFSVVERSAWESAKFKVSKHLLQSATDQIDREYFTAADDFLEPHIAEEEGGALVAYFEVDGEPMCCLIGCIADAIAG